MRYMTLKILGAHATSSYDCEEVAKKILRLDSTRKKIIAVLFCNESSEDITREWDNAISGEISERRKNAITLNGFQTMGVRVTVILRSVIPLIVYFCILTPTDN